MARGQAFETMMLVISVIVALAILGVLLNILGIFGGGTIGGDPLSTIKDSLRDIHSRTYGSTTPKKVTFEAGKELRRGEFTTDLPIKTESIQMFCADDDICGSSNSPITVSSDNKMVTPHKKFDIMVEVCGNEARNTDPLYCIVFASNAEKASTECATKCGLDQ